MELLATLQNKLFLEYHNIIFQNLESTKSSSVFDF